jgi:DNA-binding helix-hairpin-helix protein with protein kinase domain
MSGLQTDRLLKVSAWPTDILTEGSGGPVRGFLMPKIDGYQPIHVLYGPKSRVSEFPAATYSFLIHAAGNLARAVATVHAHGHVIGDINHANIVVSDKATVGLIDCDSFQVAANGRQFLCAVGVTTYQPPEMLSLPSFRDVIRTPNQDNFGLAVLIFQLLMMGRHPFSGRFLAGGDMPIERAIMESRFAYGSSAAVHQMSPPPHSIPLEALPGPVVSLFERAFLVDGRTQVRPTADEWITAMDGVRKSLRRCARNSSHSYRATLLSCPLCAIEALTGGHFFAVVQVASHPRDRSGTFDVTTVWAEIVAVTSPGKAPSWPDYRSLTVNASPETVASGQRRRFRNGIAVLLVAMGVLAWATGVPLAGGLGFWSFAALSGIGFFAVADRENPRMVEARRRLDLARSDWEKALKAWNQEAGEDAFIAKRAQLTNARQELEQLPAKHQERLRQLKVGRREREFQQHLGRHRLVNAKVPSIGPSRTATLSSYGIETAADVDPIAVARIPGFGSSLTESLMGWRRQVENTFRFDPNKGVDPKDIAALQNETKSTQARLEQSLRAGASALSAISRKALQQRVNLRPQVDRSLKTLAQAEAERRAS